jgi:hypothetical protein
MAIGFIVLIAVNQRFFDNIMVMVMLWSLLIGIGGLVLSLMFGYIRSKLYSNPNEFSRTYGLLTVSTSILVLYAASNTQALSWILPVTAIAWAAIIETIINFLNSFVRLSLGLSELHWRIKGLMLYMEVAEEKLMTSVNKPEHNNENFEKYLPYAIALKMDKRWCKKYQKDILAGGSVSELTKTLAVWNSDRGLKRAFLYSNRKSGKTSSSSGSGSSSTSSYSSRSRSASSRSSRSSGGGGGGGGGRGW